MKISDTKFNGVKLIDEFHAGDNRGSFTKIFHEEDFNEAGMCTNYAEVYYSASKKNTIRGMHFQKPPYDHEKLVHVIRGSIKDVIVDLRKSSKAYGQALEVCLSDQKSEAVYIPKGFAHGFLALEEDTIVIYMVSTVYNRESDCGIAYDSIPYDWKVENPIVSDRDRSHCRLEDFQSPF